MIDMEHHKTSLNACLWIIKFTSKERHSPFFEYLYLQLNCSPRWFLLKMLLRVEWWIKHFQGRKASAFMLAGTLTAQVVTIFSSDSQTTVVISVEWSRGRLLILPTQFTYVDVDLWHSQVKRAAVEVLQWRYLSMWCYWQYWGKKKGNFIFLRLLFDHTALVQDMRNIFLA